MSPNLGRPRFLNIDLDLRNKTFQTELLFISNIRDLNEFEESIIDKIRLIPILEYKWKLKTILEQFKKEKELKRKKKSFWARWKKKRAQKKKEKKRKKKLKRSKGELPKRFNFSFIQIEKIHERFFAKLKPRAFRGNQIVPFILKVKPTFITLINRLNYDEFCSPREYLIKHKVFRNLDKFYKVLIEFDLSEEVLEFLKRRNFVMFDIVLKNRRTQNQIQYHSIVVSKQEWRNFSFVHATDLHLAERNDRIYGIIKKWTKMFNEVYVNAALKEQKKYFENIGKIEDDWLKTEEIHKPLKKRLVNPNNQYRKFIKLMNKKVFQNDLDFIALTGDLIDFTILSKIPKDERIFDYDHTNWKIFKDITLNLPQKKRKGMRKGEELLCPIFTIPGNHDYRPFHYDMRWGALYRKMGLKASEAIALNDKFLAVPITAIVKSTRALKAYWAEINPSLDFYFRLGNSNFIFLNTGSDSYKNFADLITGHPSLTGVTNRQIQYLENIVRDKIDQDNDNTFLFLHGPIINTKKKIGLIKRVKKKFGKRILTKIEEFRESILKKLGRKPSKIRIDKKFNIRYGTVSTNWEKLIKFCKDYCILTLNGHTHALKEFRLVDQEEGKSKIFKSRSLNLKKSEKPVAVFYDIYSDIFTNATDIENYGPFVVHTPALGLGGYRKPRLTGAFREINIEDGKLASFKVKYINR
ncbi:MAG: metallophosphoesterase [Promethearchaeota archaeon]